MRITGAELQRLGERIVEALVKEGYVKLRADAPAVSKRFAALILKNLEEEAALEEEAERFVEQHRREMAGMDQGRMIQLVKKRLAEERGFSL